MYAVSWSIKLWCIALLFSWRIDLSHLSSPSIMFQDIYRNVKFLTINVIRKMQRQPEPPIGRNVLSLNPFLVFSPPQLTSWRDTTWRLPPGTAVLSPSRSPRAPPSLLHRPARWPMRVQKTKTISCGEKKVKKPQASSYRTAGCSIVETEGESQSSILYDDQLSRNFIINFFHNFICNITH